jgi:hypothetical protein
MEIQMWGDWRHVRIGGFLSEFLMRISHSKLGDEAWERVFTEFWHDQEQARAKRRDKSVL